MLHSINDNTPLSGVTVLVVEDDLLLAMDLEQTLRGMGAVIVAVCRSLDEAMARADADDFAVAVLDFNLGSESVTPFARRLAGRNAPFILHTGMSRSEPALMEWSDTIIVAKPASPHKLVTAIKSVLEGRQSDGKAGASLRVAPCARPEAEENPRASRAQPAWRARD